MKNKRKKDVSDNGGSENSDNLPSSLKTSVHLEKSSKIKNSPKKKSASDSDNRCNEGNELHITEPGAEVLENTFRSEKASKETTNSEFRENNSNNNDSVSIKSVFNIEELTSDDEIYTLQCPENYIKQNLCNKIVDFTEPKQTITHNNEMFLLELLNCEKKFITLAVPTKLSGGSLIKMPLKGHIVIQKVIEMPLDKCKDNCDNNDAIFDRHKVIFPDNIKVRHPLLGAEWKAHIDIANEAIRKEYSVKKNRTKKKKSQKIKEVDIRNLKRETSNAQITVQKKKRKKSNA